MVINFNKMTTLFSGGIQYYQETAIQASPPPCFMLYYTSAIEIYNSYITIRTSNVM